MPIYIYTRNVLRGYFSANNLMWVIYLICSSVCHVAYAGALGTLQVNMSGTIVTSSCDVSTSSATQSIYLGAIQAGDFSSKGTTSPSKLFTIELTGCSESITGASVTFSGTADSKNSKLLALTNTGTQANGVAVQLLDATNTVIPINTTTASYFVSPNSNTLTFSLRYKSTLATVTPGDANAVLYFDMSYQ